MYFHSRAEAGNKLAERLFQYRYENCAVVALSHGGLAVAEPIAARLHAMLGLLLSDEIGVPGEGVRMGTINQNGHFVYNHQLSHGEIDDYYSEYHGYFEDQKRVTWQKINHLLADGGALDLGMLREHVVILVSDGLKTGGILDAAIDFLKPVRLKRLVIVTPVASVSAVDRMHILGDEIHCLGVTENYLSTSHYYDVQDVPSHEEAVDKINKIVLKWM